MRLIFGALGLAVLPIGCGAPAESEDLAGIESPIVGGQETPTCAWPTTVSFSKGNAGCTATLIHPKLISIAAHCVEGSGNAEIDFADTTNQSRRNVAITGCTARTAGLREDFAFCTLAQEVTDIPIIPVLFGCETQILRPGQEVALVGYGFIGANTQSPGGHKRWVTTTIRRVTATQIDIGDATHGNCFGDSGGPAFVKMPDGTWRVFGATSTTSSPPCASYGTWALIPPFVSWVEQQTNLDITPCYDAATGAWNPGPACTGVPQNPEVSGGTWAKMCTENLQLSGPLAACGGLADAGLPDAAVDARRPDASGGRDGASSDAAPTDGAARDATSETGSAGAGGGGAAGSTGATGGAGAGGGNGGTGGAAGTTGAAMGGQAGTTSGAGGGNHPPTSPPPDSVGGCSCRLAANAGAAPPPTLGWFIAALVALVASRRRADETGSSRSGLMTRARSKTPSKTPSRR